MDLNICDIRLHPERLEASVYIDPKSTWRPNVKKNKLKLITTNEAVIFSPTISDIQDNHFNIRVDVELSLGTDYKLIYLDENNSERGVSSTFTYSPCVESAELVSTSLQSSGSFEAVSDDENSFTVINAESMSISKDWEITGSSTDSETEDSENCDQLYPNRPDKLEKEAAFIETSATADINNSKSHLCNDETTKLPSNGNEIKQTSQFNVVSSSKDVLLEIEEEEEEAVLPCHESMSKSVVLGAEHLSQSEVKSLQTRNRAHFKKINKLSELLDSEKKVSAELLETVMKKTEENTEMCKIIDKLKHDLHDSQKKLRRANRDCADKASLIASLRDTNKSLQEQLDRKKKGEPQGKRISPSKKRWSGFKSKDSKEDDRMCDIAIVRHRKQHDHKEGEDEQQQIYYKDRSDHRSRHSPHKQDRSYSPSDIKYTTQAGSGNDFVCPICDRQMPSTLTERQMTIHIESCLQKREA